jgi:methylaspartate mutase sigma subunit
LDNVDLIKDIYYYTIILLYYYVKVVKAVSKKTLVLGVIGSDVHAVGNKILDYAFTEAGFKVINLGVMVSQEEFIEAAIETAADAILVSSLYGHGELDCRGLREKCDEAGLQNIPLYVGGNLVVGKAPFEEVEKKFEDMGFNRVYPPGTLPDTAIVEIKKDLGAE